MQAGFNEAVANPQFISIITECLFSSSIKLKAQVAEVLAAVCVLSAQEGHPAVLAAFSEFRIAFSEQYRFDYLLNTFEVHDTPPVDNDAYASDIDEETILWEYRVSVMALINAITNSPEDLEARILLRDEFSRRGLNEMMTVGDSN